MGSLGPQGFEDGSDGGSSSDELVGVHGFFDAEEELGFLEDTRE